MVKKGDFIELDYTGKDKESGIVFDTTYEKTAKENHFYSEKASYKPVIICLGEKQILPGIDKNLEGKEIGKDISFEISPEEGFGKKNAKLLRIIPSGVFKKQKLNPMPGMQVNVDGSIGLVKTAGGGRIIVDFNHPLAGKDLLYDVKIHKIVTDGKEKIESFLTLVLQLKKEDFDIIVEGDNAKIKLKKKIPDPIKDALGKKLGEITKLKINFVQ